MSYIPTEEELLDMEFKDKSYVIKDIKNIVFASKRFDNGQSQIFVSMLPGGVVFELYVFDQDNDTEQCTRLNISSRQDVETLIRLLSPN